MELTHAILAQEYSYNTKVFFDALVENYSERTANVLLKSFSYEGSFSFGEVVFERSQFHFFVKSSLEESYLFIIREASKKGFYRFLRTYVKVLYSFSSGLFFSHAREPGSLIFLNSPLLESVLSLLKENRTSLAASLFKKTEEKNEKNLDDFLEKNFSYSNLYRKKSLVNLKNLSLSHLNKKKLKAFLVLGTLRDYILKHLGLSLRDKIRKGGFDLFLMNFFYYFESLEVRFLNLKNFSYHKSLLLLDDDEPILLTIVKKENIELFQRFFFLVGPPLFSLDAEDRSFFDYCYLLSKNPRLVLAGFEAVLERKVLNESICRFLSSPSLLEGLITRRAYRYYRDFLDPVLNELYEIYRLSPQRIFHFE